MATDDKTPGAGRPRGTERRLRERMTTEEVQALPVRLTFAETYRALGLGRSAAYKMVREGTFPIPLLPYRNTYLANKSDVLRSLGLSVPGREGAA